MLTDNSRSSGLKLEILKYYEHWLTTIEVRPRVYDMPKKMFI